MNADSTRSGSSDTNPPNPNAATIGFTGGGSVPDDFTIPGYEIICELGRGGAAVVYKAQQQSLRRTVALKLMLSGDQADARSKQRFLAEAEAIASVRHPNVVEVYEFGQHAGRTFYALEYLSCGSLSQAIAEAGRFDARTAAALVREIAIGVQAIHDRGIVHRDLKPGNVLLAESGKEAPEGSTSFLATRVPKVADFGLAKRASSADLTNTGAVMGTPSYMAPEQARGDTKDAGPAADIYALGAILFDCLTGRPPFVGDDSMSVMMRVIEDDAPAVREFAPNTPRDLEAICRKCLQKDPQSRYPSAAAVAEDLRCFLDGESVSARSTGIFGRVAGVLSRSHKDSEFAAYGYVMFGFAAVTLFCDTAITLGAFGWFSKGGLLAFQYGRLAMYFIILFWCRKGRILPRTAGERQLWSAVGGYTVACVGGAMAIRLHLGWGPEIEPLLYQVFTALAALTFFSLGSTFWGWCYAIGVVFLAAGCLMAIDLRFAPLIFGVTWATMLCVIGVRLLKLERARG